MGRIQSKMLNKSTVNGATVRPLLIMFRSDLFVGGLLSIELIPVSSLGYQVEIELLRKALRNTFPHPNSA